MFRQYILTFLEVAETKSFSAAAENLYITPNAVKKRVETLEKETGLKLFRRNNRGCALTQAGESLCVDLQKINKLYATAVANAAGIQAQSDSIIQMGIMSTFAESFLTNDWYNVRQKLCNQQIELRQYGAAFSEMDAMLKQVGDETMMCVDIYDEEIAKNYGLGARKISSFPVYVGFPCNVETPKKSPLPMECLAECSVVLLRRGRAKAFDTVHDQIQRKAPGVKIETIEEYNVHSMNDAFMKRQVVVVGQNQMKNYPFFVFMPLDTTQTIDFGVYYKKNDAKALCEFLDKITAVRMWEPYEG